MNQFDLTLNSRILSGLEAHPEEPFRDPLTRLMAFVDGRFEVSVDDARRALLELAERETSSANGREPETQGRKDEPMATDKTAIDSMDAPWRHEWNPPADASPAPAPASPASLEDRDRESRLDFELRQAISELERMPETELSKSAKTIARFVLGDPGTTRLEAMAACFQMRAAATKERTGDSCR